MSHLIRLMPAWRKADEKEGERDEWLDDGRSHRGQGDGEKYQDPSWGYLRAELVLKSKPKTVSYKDLI